MKEDVISGIKNGNEQAVVELYNTYKNDFIRWSGFRYQLDEEDALDVFQEVVISFYENVKKGKLDKINYQLKTYLFAIGKNMIINRIKYDQRFDHGADPTDEVETFNLAEQEIEVNQRHGVIIAQLEKMGEPCYSILKLFFYDSFSMEAIANNLQYKNSNVVKSQKLRCINELRKRVKENYGPEDL